MSQQFFRRELWELVSQLWSLPLSVEWHFQDDVALVRLGHGLPLLECQRREGCALLDRVGERTGNRWSIPRGNLLTVARISDKTNPEDVLRWELGRPKVIEEDPDPGQKRHDETFYAECAKAGIVPSPKAAEILHRSFCKVALHCLVNLHIPVNMMYAILYAVPYRVNWQAMVFRKMNLRKPPELQEALLDPRLLAWPRGADETQWTLGVEYRPMWRNMVAKAEQRARDLFRQIHNANYLVYLVDTIKHLMPTTKRLYGQWIREIEVPYVSLVADHGRKSPRGFPTSKAAIRQNRYTSVAVPPNMPDCWDAIKATEAPGQRFDLPETDADMPTVSGLRPVQKDVRIPR